MRWSGVGCLKKAGVEGVVGGEEEEVEFTQSLGGCGGRLSPLLRGRGSDLITILNETETESTAEAGGW